MSDYDRIKLIEFKEEKTDLLSNLPKQIVAISGEDFDWLIEQAYYEKNKINHERQSY